MTSTIVKRFGLSALLAGAAIVTMLGQASPAAAKDVASGQATGKRQHEPVAGVAKEYDKSTPKLLEFVATQEEVDAMIAAVSEQLAQLKSRCDQMGSLAVEADAEIDALQEGAAASSAQVDEAQRVFDEQVASLLDPDTVKLVSSSLEQLRAQGTFSDGSSDGTSLTESVQPVNEKLDELLALLETLKQASKEVKNNGEGKKEYTGHVTLLK